MEIKKRLILTGSNGVNAVLLNDEGEEYPVFLESLHNTIIFPALIDSGYTLTSMPYGFTKNGVSIDSLPVENYQCDTAQMELMYNSTGVKLPTEEIKKHIKVEEAVGVPTPPTAYTIYTREDLLKYLDATSLASIDTDVMPLNYFVAPEARFSLEEYQSDTWYKYVQLINKRREMSLDKFRRLIVELQKINLGVNPSAQDVLDAYFAWGMDGLNFVTMSRRRESRAFRLSPNRNVNTPNTRITYGMMDGMGNQLTPTNERDVVWKLSNENSKSMDVSALTAGMKPDDVFLVEYSAPVKREVTVMEGPRYSIQYNTETLIMQLQTYPSLRVKSPVDVGTFIELQKALPQNEEQLVEHCAIDALARLMYDMRKPRVRVSSYDALRVAGCNPQTILNYVVTSNGMNTGKATSQNGEALPVILWNEIDDYLAGKQVDEDVREFLDDVINGVHNIDSIAQGKNMEAQVSTTLIYRELYALHHVLGISFREIYEKFKAIDEKTKTIVFTGNGLNYTMDVAPLKYSTNGYLRDCQSYDLQNAQNCNFFTYVIRVAREVGDVNAKRHVGIELYFVNKKFDDVQGVLHSLRSDYLEKLSTAISDVNKRRREETFVDMFAMSRFFEIALKGTITYPTSLGGNTIQAMPEVINTCRRRLERRIENITAFCNFTATTDSIRSLSFDAYCVNAYITPDCVIPRGNYKIPEAPFYSLWTNWQSVNPTAWSQLVQLGVIPSDFVAWELRYFNEQFVKRDIFELDREDSLLYYYQNAMQEVKNYPVDKEFISVQHPMEYMYPGLYASDEDDLDSYKKLSTPRAGAPVVRLGANRIIGLEDYKHKLYPTELVADVDSYIRPMRGLNADVVMNVDNVLSKLPKETECSITVMAKSESIYLSDTQEVRNFRTLTGLDPNRYPVVHLYDRLYILRSVDGKLWEAYV